LEAATAENKKASIPSLLLELSFDKALSKECFC